MQIIGNITYFFQEIKVFLVSLTKGWRGMDVSPLVRALYELPGIKDVGGTNGMNDWKYRKPLVHFSVSKDCDLGLQIIGQALERNYGANCYEWETSFQWGDSSGDCLAHGYFFIFPKDRTKSVDRLVNCLRQLNQ